MEQLNVEICDVTLRDGEQTPGVSFTCDEKLDIAGKLDMIGIDVIESGFPVVSEDERRCVKTIAGAGLSSRICCLARAIRADVECAISCDVDMVSIFIATSELHVKHKYKKPRDVVLANALEMVEFAKDHGLEVRFAAEDASRTELDFLEKMYNEGIEHGADLVSYADTVGFLTPMEIYQNIKKLASSVDGPLCIHCHNDLGFASANTITAAEAGAFQLHTTVNGIGERAGNAALEEVMATLYLKHDIDRYDLSHINTLSHMVSEYSGIKVQKHKAVVGEHAFAHESGIHIAAMIEDNLTYEFVPPELFGRERRFLLGKHSGKKAIKHIVENYGYDLTDGQIMRVLEEVKSKSQGKCCITREVLCSIIRHITEEE